jgi:putative membrane protein
MSLADLRVPEAFELLWGLISLAFVVGVAFAIVGVIRGGVARSSSSPALRILEERYARGEISRDEFLERRAVLAGDKSH